MPPTRNLHTLTAVDERDQSFAEAVRAHSRVVDWYRSCGYVLDEVPRLPVANRVEHVLRVLLS